MPTRFTAYRLDDDAPPLVPGTPERGWMDRLDKFAYRCIPLTVANTSGWELLSPRSFMATWTGGPLAQDITLTAIDGGDPDLGHLVASHFHYGILTFHPGYIFRTDPGWALQVRGSPNLLRDGIAPLDGLVETDWMPFTFTMNWQFTRPGSVMFMKGDPFCFLTPIEHVALDAITPVVKPLSSDPVLEAEYEAWGASRSAFVARIASGEPEALKQAWQRFYLRGSFDPDGPVAETHVPKRRLAKPIEQS